MKQENRNFHTLIQHGISYYTKKLPQSPLQGFAVIKVLSVIIIR